MAENARQTATPWGKAALVERVTVKQQAAEKRFASVFELLETDRGERLVRIAYSTSGAARAPKLASRPCAAQAPSATPEAPKSPARTRRTDVRVTMPPAG